MVRIAAFLGLVAAVASPAVSAADLARGKMLYQRHCAACHGATGLSVMPNTPNLALNQGLTQSDLQIMQTLKMGSPRKPPFIGMMSDAELLDVVAYVRTIR